MPKSPKLAADIVGIWSVFPPVIVNAAGIIYDRAISGRCKKIIIQNLADSNVFYALNQDASETSFHGLIKANNSLELDDEQATAIFKISLFSKSQVNAVVTIYKGT